MLFNMYIKELLLLVYNGGFGRLRSSKPLWGGALDYWRNME